MGENDVEIDALSRANDSDDGGNPEGGCMELMIWSALVNGDLCTRTLVQCQGHLSVFMKQYQDAGDLRVLENGASRLMGRLPTGKQMKEIIYHMEEERMWSSGCFVSRL